MFKNIITFRIGAECALQLETIEESLQKMPFVECGQTQERSFGWVPPRGDAHGLMAESIGGQFIPMATTWLNQRRWEDQVQVQMPSTSSKFGDCDAVEPA